MSSILEALKELESERARGAKKATSVADVPSTPPRSFGMLLALGGGLAFGVLALGVYLWSARTQPDQPIETAIAGPSAPPASDPAPMPRGPEWLGRAEPPRARVAPVPPAAPPAPAAAPAAVQRAAAPEAATPIAMPAPSEPAAAPVPIERAVAPAPAVRAAAPAPPSRAASAPPATVPAAPLTRAEAPAHRVSGQEVRLEALAFSSHVHQRTVTLLVDGRRATLHQGESLGGVEVQLIMADGAYLQRGADVFFIGKPR